MDNEFEAKQYPAQAVYVRASFVRKMLDHLELTKKDGLVIRVVEHMVVGIDTETPQLLRLPKPDSVKRLEAAKTSGVPNDVTKESVFATVQASNGRISTVQIGDKLAIPRNDTLARQRITKVLRVLIAKKQVSGFKSGTSKRITSYSLYIPGTPTTELSRKNITTEIVLNTLREHGESSSMEISDHIGLPRKEASTRSKVTTVLKDLITLNQIITLSEKKQGQPIYKLK